MRYSVTDNTGREVKEGDRVLNFRGKLGTFEKVIAGPKPGQQAQVLVSGQEVRAGEWNLTVKPTG